MSDIVVDVQQISKSFGHDQVLKNASLQLEEGKIHGTIAWQMFLTRRKEA